MLVIPVLFDISEILCIIGILQIQELILIMNVVCVVLVVAILYCDSVLVRNIFIWGLFCSV